MIQSLTSRRPHKGRLKRPGLEGRHRGTAPRPSNLLGAPGRILILLLTAGLLLVAEPANAQLPAPAAAQAKADTAVPAPVPLRSPDQEIQARLAQLFAEVDGLHGVRATVHGGVVELSGSVLTAADADKALDIAQRLEGVASVQSDLATEHRVSRRLEPLVQRVRSLLETSLSFVPLLVIAALAFFACWYAGRWLTGRTRLFRRLAPNAVVIDRAQDHALMIKAFGWVDQTRSDLGKVKSEAMRAAKQDLEAAGTPLAAPTWNLRYLGRPRSHEARATPPAGQELAAVTDTSADHTLRRKVNEIRRDCQDEDLLDAPSRPSPVEAGPAPSAA